MTTLYPSIPFESADVDASIVTPTESDPATGRIFPTQRQQDSTFPYWPNPTPQNAVALVSVQVHHMLEDLKINRNPREEGAYSEVNIPVINVPRIVIPSPQKPVQIQDAYSMGGLSLVDYAQKTFLGAAQTGG